MISFTTASTAISSLISIFLLMCVYFFFVRDVFDDTFRQEMFSLRYDLFDLWSESKITFNHPAYRLTETTINGFIRFGHRISFSQVFIAYILCHKGVKTDVDEPSFDKEWEASMSNLPEELKKRMAAIRYKMNMLTLVHMTRSSPVLTIFLIALLPGSILMQAISYFSRAFKGKWRKQIINSVDSTALEFGYSLQNANGVAF